MMKINFNPRLRKPEPIPEYQRVSDIVDGVEVVSYVPAVYPDFPPASDFSLENLMKTGVSPESLHISTQSTDRLDGVSQINEFSAEAEAILNPNLTE